MWLALSYESFTAGRCGKWQNSGRRLRDAALRCKSLSSSLDGTDGSPGQTALPYPKSYLAETKVTVGLLSGSLSNADRRQVLHDAETGQIDLLVGTQALLHGGVRFSQLGLCVVDEQHKFGVAQREMLEEVAQIPTTL